MDVFSVAFALYRPDRTRFRSLTGVVDTGASFTVIPAATLDELGITRDKHALFSLADGSIQELALGNAMIEVQGYVASVSVVFGSDRRKTLIGARTLATLRLAVDPVYERLLPVDRIVLLDDEDTP